MSPLISTFREKIFKSVFFLFSIILGSVLILFGCSKNDYSSNSNNGTPGTNEIFIQGMAFTPANKTISVGTKITWINKDATNHTVTSGVPNSPDGIFDSGNMGQNKEFSYTFNAAGIFKYYCDIHHSMTGTITVQ